MRRTTDIVTAATAAVVSLRGLVVCSSSFGKKDGGRTSVYYLSLRPKTEKTWKRVMAEYKKRTGVEIKIRTAMVRNYEQTPKTEINKSDVPTLFDVNGPIGLKNREKYVSDLSDKKLTKYPTRKDLVLKDGDGKIYGVPFITEDYGIVYNDAIMRGYFALPDVKMKSIDEIKGFNRLREVTEDMQAKKDRLGIKGAFAPMSLASREDWRWHTHLANYSPHYELKDVRVEDTDTLKGTYPDNYKKIFDLYLKNSTVSPSEANNKSVSDSMSEFARSQAAIVQNGNWAWEQIEGDKGSVVKPEDVHFLLIYTGTRGKERSSTTIETGNYLAPNNRASEVDKKTLINSANWLYITKGGTKPVFRDPGFITPFDIPVSQNPSDPLGKKVVKYVNNKNLDPMTWDFTVFSSEGYRRQLGSHLRQYAVGKEEWSDVAKYSTSEWKKGKEQNKGS